MARDTLKQWITGKGSSAQDVQSQQSGVPERRGNEIYRDGEREPAPPAVVHIELHWPKYLAVVLACISVYYYLSAGKTGGSSLVMAPLLVGVFGYFMLNGVRNMLDHAYRVRTMHSRSPAFKLGALAGLAVFVYSTFISPFEYMGVETGMQTAFYDGFDRRDIGVAAALFLQAIIYMGVGGYVFDFLSKRFFGAGKSAEKGNG